MNIVRVFLVAWLVEHPRMAPRLVEGQGTSDREKTPIALTTDTDISHSYSNFINDCILLCSHKSTVQYKYSRNAHSGSRGYVEEELIFLNGSVSKGFPDIRRGRERSAVRGVSVTRKAARSVHVPLKLSTSFAQSENPFGDMEMNKREEKDLTILLNGAPSIDEQNEKLRMNGNIFSDFILSIPNRLSYSDDLLSEQFESDVIVETENSSVRNEDVTLLTEDLRTLEKSHFEKNSSLISIVMEEEKLMNVHPTLISAESVASEVSFDSEPPLTPESNSSGDVLAVFRSRYPVDQWESLGYFTEDYLQLINKHWLQFQPPYPSSHYVLAALYAVVMTVGVTGNCLVIFMFIRCRSLRTPANVLVMNLALSDFFLLAKMPVFIFNCFYFGPALGAVGCEIYGFLGGLTGTVSIMTLAAIALDRYYVIVYPLDPLRRTTRQRARLCVAFVWCYGSTFASLPLTGYGFSRYVPEGYLTSCSFDYLDQSVSSRVFILVFFFAAWVVPFSVITFCYIKIYRVVISGSSGATSRRGQEEEKRKTEIRLAGVIVGVIGLWFLAWTPYAIVAILGISGNARLISPLSSMIPALFCKTASCIDPYVYAVTHPRFRREFHRFFCNKQKRRRFEIGKTQCWKTESSQIPGMMIGIRHQRVDYSLSEEDIEEMVVMVDSRPQKATYFASSTIAPEEHNLCEITFPPDSRTNEMLQHPSWFMPPQPRRDRSTSLKLTGNRSSKTAHMGPTSV